jgi:hypothetical protein
VTTAQARETYGVVIDPQSKAIDAEATRRARADHQKAQAVAAGGGR